MPLNFTKMHGLGNDYVYVEAFTQPLPEDVTDLARRISHRRFGVGGDGLIVIRPSAVADARMQMLNADGSESEMCGNGIRCVARYLFDRGLARRRLMKIETGNGVLEIELDVDAKENVTGVTVDMGRPVTHPAEVPTTLRGDDETAAVVDLPVDFDGHTLNVTCVSMGNPHCVIFVEEATDDLVLGLGPKIETDPRFPNRVNVEFVEVVSPTEVRQRTWERGSGETWACGTGASAVCVAGVLTGRTESSILNHLVGGDLRLRYDARGAGHVFMTGPATHVFDGVWQ